MELPSPRLHLSRSEEGPLSQDSLVRWGIGGQGGNAIHPVCSHATRHRSEGAVVSGSHRCLLSSGNRKDRPDPSTSSMSWVLFLLLWKRSWFCSQSAFLQMHFTGHLSVCTSLSPGFGPRSCPVQGTSAASAPAMYFFRDLRTKGDRRCRLRTNAAKGTKEPLDQTPSPCTHVYREH